MSDELELLFNKDVPVVPEVEFDYKKMLQNCKMGKEKHNIKLFKYVLNACFCAILCLIFVLTTVIIIKNNTSIEKKDKIEIVKSHLINTSMPYGPMCQVEPRLSLPLTT